MRDISGRFSKLRQRYGIAAPRVQVQSQMPWYLRWLVIALAVGIAAAVAAWTYDAGRRYAGFDQGEVQSELGVTKRDLAAAQAAKREVGLVFVPHLTPIIRGIHATLYARVTREADFQSLYGERYAREPFVDVMPAGSHPDTRSVRSANVCRIALHRPPQASGKSDMLVVLSVIDNLTKGAAGQAVQNMNLMFGVPETTGLAQPPLVP